MAPARILIVEDESILAMDIEEILSSLGYEVVAIAIDAEEAIAAVPKFNPDLILMDVRIQGKMDGIEATHYIWNQFGIPVVFLTASTDEKTVKRIAESPSVDYVPKPFEMKKLAASVELALAKHRGEHE